MSRNLNPPEWATAIASLRKRLRLSQSEFARKMNVSAMTVSRWERGTAPPASHFCLELGKLAGPPKGWYFWNLAGLTETDVQVMIRHMPSTKDSRIARVIGALELQAAQSDIKSRRITAAVFHAPTGLRRQIKAISDDCENCSKVIKAQAAILHGVYASESGKR